LILSLAADTLYHYTVKSNDAVGNPTVSGDSTLTTATPGASTVPELPRVFIDTTYAPPSGKTIAVPAGGDFQAALNSAQLGDTITLQAGATYTGPFNLPKKSGSGWIYIQTSAYGLLPSPGTRVTPADAMLMPKIVVGVEPALSAIVASPGAHHYRFVGIEILPVAGTFHTELILLAPHLATNIEDLSQYIFFDRCYIHGDPVVGSRRGITMHSRYAAVIDSYLSDFKEVGADTQTIVSWNGAGPFKIVNNYLEAAGENIMFGGAATSIINLTPSDIEIRGNHFFKPLSWRKDDPSYAGIPWTVKNLFEIKHGQRLLMEGNIFEHNWAGSQVGRTLVFTPTGQFNTTRWAVGQDVTFRNNIVRETAVGLALSGNLGDTPDLGVIGRRMAFENNLWLIDSTIYGGNGIFFTTAWATDITFDHNTIIQSGSILAADAPAEERFIFRNNIVNHGPYGIVGSGLQVGSLTLNTLFPGAVFVKNVLVGPYPTVGGATISMYSDYPDNFFPQSLDDVDFVDLAGGDYRLSDTSPYKNAGTDGKDLGADIDAIEAATSCVISGNCAGIDTTPPTLSNGQPTGTLPNGTNSTTLSLTTNENADCKYSTTSGVSYASMANTFSTTSGASHSTTVSG